EGDLHVSVGEGGELEIASFSARSEVQAQWKLPGGITLKDFAASIAYDAQKGFGASIAGGFTFEGAEFSAGAELRAALVYDGKDISFKGAIEHVDLTVHDQVKIADAGVGFEFRTKDRFGKLTLDSGDCALIRGDDGEY